MSSFHCRVCNVPIVDIPDVGYISGCPHFKADVSGDGYVFLTIDYGLLNEKSKRGITSVGDQATVFATVESACEGYRALVERRGQRSVEIRGKIIGVGKNVFEKIPEDIHLQPV